jgi:hypothetical protein
MHKVLKGARLASPEALQQLFPGEVPSFKIKAVRVRGKEVRESFIVLAVLLLLFAYVIMNTLISY